MTDEAGRLKVGPGRPAGGDSGDTRQRVIEAAARSFANYGYGPATLMLIADEAGVTAGSIHYHFGTKPQLFEAVCDEVYDKLIQRGEQAMAGDLSFADLLRNVLSGAMRINHELPDLAAFVASAPIDARRHPELSQAFTKQSTKLSNAFARAVSRGQDAGLIPRECQPAEVAALISALVDGFAHTAAATDPITMDRLNALFQALLLDPAGRAIEPISSSGA